MADSPSKSPNERPEPGKETIKPRESHKETVADSRRSDSRLDLEREKVIYRKQFEDSNKPPQVIDKIVEGKINSYYEQVVLLDQPSIRDPKTTIGAMVTAAVATMGENITIARFARFKVGEAQT